MSLEGEIEETFSEIIAFAKSLFRSKSQSPNSSPAMIPIVIHDREPKVVIGDDTRLKIGTMVKISENVESTIRWGHTFSKLEHGIILNVYDNGTYLVLWNNKEKMAMMGQWLEVIHPMSPRKIISR